MQNTKVTMSALVIAAVAAAVIGIIMLTKSFGDAPTLSRFQSLNCEYLRISESDPQLADEYWIRLDRWRDELVEQGVLRKYVIPSPLDVYDYRGIEQLQARLRDFSSDRDCEPYFAVSRSLEDNEVEIVVWVTPESYAKMKTDLIRLAAEH